MPANLLLSEFNNSMLRELATAHVNRYTPFGFSRSSGRRYNGQWPEAQGMAYLLGNGQRAYMPSLMRFGSSDLLSPFAQGGVNAYAYCAAEPTNRNDPGGRFFRALWAAASSAPSRAYQKIVDFFDWLWPVVPLQIGESQAARAARLLGSVKPATLGLSDNLPNIGETIARREAREAMGIARGVRQAPGPSAESTRQLSRYGQQQSVALRERYDQHSNQYKKTRQYHLGRPLPPLPDN